MVQTISGTDTPGDFPCGLGIMHRGCTVLGNRLLVADTTGDELFEIDPDGAGDHS